MNYSKSVRETDQLRCLAHQLRDGLVRENVVTRRGWIPLPERVGRVLEATRVWASSQKAENYNELRARAERIGAGRTYMEDVVLRLEQDRLEMKFTRWVKDQTQSYCGGSWSYCENYQTGEVDCRSLPVRARNVC